MDASAAMYYNNLACIHMMMRKHHLGSFYFRKALTENENLAKELKLETLGMLPSDLSPLTDWEKINVLINHVSSYGNLCRTHY